MKKDLIIIIVYIAFIIFGHFIYINLNKSVDGPRMNIDGKCLTLEGEEGKI